MLGTLCVIGPPAAALICVPFARVLQHIIVLFHKSLTSSKINSFFLMAIINSSLIHFLFTKTSLLYHLHSSFFLNFVLHFSILSSSFFISSTFFFLSRLLYPLLIYPLLSSLPWFSFPLQNSHYCSSPHNPFHSSSSRNSSGERYLSSPFYVPYTVCNCAHLIKHSLKSQSKNLNKFKFIVFFHRSHCDPVWNYIFQGTFLHYLAP